MSKPLVIAIDGPAGAGKSSVTAELAQKLGYALIDTGAMYRSVTLALMQISGDSEISKLADYEWLNKSLHSISYRYEKNVDKYLYFLNDKDVTTAIRTPEVTSQVSKVSAAPLVRNFAVDLQRQLARVSQEQGTGVVVEGRDIGTTVLPNAEVKIFLTASIAERARRRALETGTSIESQIPLIAQRDLLDETREFSPLRRAEDAVLVDSTSLSFEEVLSTMVSIVRTKQTQIDDAK